MSGHAVVQVEHTTRHNRARYTREYQQQCRSGLRKLETERLAYAKVARESLCFLKMDEGEFGQGTKGEQLSDP